MRSDRKTTAFAAALAAAALALAACAPERQPAGPRVEAPRIEGSALVAGDGARLPLHVWRSAGRPRAVILGVHGLNDYGAAFAIPAESWTAAGIAVYGFDQRGFGAAGAPGIWAGADTLIDDLADAATALRRRHPALPLHVVGVSMGGAVAAAALAEGRLRGVAGVALVAPAVRARATMPFTHRAALWLAARTTPWMKLSGRGLGIVASDNDEMLRALGRDPLVLKETRADTLAGLVDLMDRAWAARPAAGKPLLLLYGARDELVPRAPTAAWRCRLGAAARAGVYRGGYHMLLRDLQAAVVHRDVASWTGDPSRPLPSGAEEEAGRFFSCPAPAPAPAPAARRRRAHGVFRVRRAAK